MFTVSARSHHSVNDFGLLLFIFQIILVWQVHGAPPPSLLPELLGRNRITRVGCVPRLAPGCVRGDNNVDDGAVDHLKYEQRKRPLNPDAELRNA